MLGVHRTASSLLSDMAQTSPELLTRTVVVDFNVAIHPRIAALGPHVVYGDITSPETLHHAGVDEARVVLCTIPDDVLASATTDEVVRVVRQVNPDAIVIATATTMREMAGLYAAGADYVLLPRLDAAASAFTAVSAALNGQIDELRAKNEDRSDPVRRREVLE